MTVDPTKISIPPLPTLPSLSATIPEDVDVQKIASIWLKTLSEAIESDMLEHLGSLFVEDSWWRDMLALTWDFHTFRGLSTIISFLRDQLGVTRPRAFKLHPEYVLLERPGEDLAWIRATFYFETEIGVGFGLFRLVPTSNREWKAHSVFTNLDDLKDFPEKTGALRNPHPNHGHWEEDRKREREFENLDPTVLIIGGGHSGLALAARLKCYEISTLVVERNERIGDNWRNRYSSLCLHDPVWYDHMPYIPFPPTWPKYTPARKLANWLESYSESLELNVWTSSTVVQASQDTTTSGWKVLVRRADGTDRIFNVKHLVFATGMGGVEPNMPRLPGMEKFKGQVLHSSQLRHAKDHAGKKVVVVGACTSGHDIAQDCYNHGIDVTMYQRGSTHVVSVNSFELFLKGVYSEGGPPIDIADRLFSSMPNFLSLGLVQRGVRFAAQLDKDILDALHMRGFRTDLGILDTGVIISVFTKGGGHYIDVGASRLVADGKIKLKNDSQIKELTESGILFENGSELPADVVICATGITGITGIKSHIGKVCGDEVVDRCSPIWGYDKEGELAGIWRNLGLQGLWYMVGNLALSRFHSKHVALQIKAMEEGIFGPRYSLT